MTQNGLLIDPVLGNEVPYHGECVSELNLPLFLGQVWISNRRTFPGLLSN